MGKDKEVVASSETAEGEKKIVKKAKVKEKKPNIFKRMGKKSKEIFSELKKVSWPTFGKVVKNTCVVLVICIIFLVLVTGVDFCLSWLLELLVGGVK